MSEEIKFTDEELKSLGELQTAYQRITNAYGQIALAKHNLEAQEASVKQEFESAKANEQKLLNEITEKYGDRSYRIKKNKIVSHNKSLFDFFCNIYI